MMNFFHGHVYKKKKKTMKNYGLTTVIKRNVLIAYNQCTDKIKDILTSIEITFNFYFV